MGFKKFIILFCAVLFILQYAVAADCSCLKCDVDNNNKVQEQDLTLIRQNFCVNCNKVFDTNNDHTVNATDIACCANPAIFNKECTSTEKYSCVAGQGCHKINPDIWIPAQHNSLEWDEPSCGFTCGECISGELFPECSIKPECNLNEKCVLSTYNQAPTPVAVCSESTDSKLCCPEITPGCKFTCRVDTSCDPDEDNILHLYNLTNSNVSSPTINQPYKLCCMSTCNKQVDCGITSNMVECYRDYDYCVASLYNIRNTGIAECNVYDHNVCCRLGEGLPACTDTCQNTATKCISDNAVQTCGNYDGDSCLEWSTPVVCPSNQVCVEGRCVDAFSCKNTCLKGVKKCDSPNSYMQCGDSNGDTCDEWSKSISCPSNQICSYGECVGCLNTCPTDH